MAAAPTRDGPRARPGPPRRPAGSSGAAHRSASARSTSTTSAPPSRTAAASQSGEPAGPTAMPRRSVTGTALAPGACPARHRGGAGPRLSVSGGRAVHFQIPRFRPGGPPGDAGNRPSAIRRSCGEPPRARRRAGLHRSCLRVPGAHQAGRRGHAGHRRGRRGWHVPEPLRARRGVRPGGSPAAAAGAGRPVPGVRPDRHRPRGRAGPRTVPARARETFYIGRLAVADEHRDPVVVDWRAPVAESFYRATGRDPMGLVRRRHFASRGRTLLGIDDELFGAATEALDEGQVQGYGALISALEETRSGQALRHRRHHPGRTGRASSAPSCPACWWSRAARAPARPWWRCTGPPTCSTPTGSRWRARACWWSAPTGCSSPTSSRCCPSLGEAGVQIAVLADLVPHVRVGGYDRPRRSPGSRATCAWST